MRYFAALRAGYLLVDTSSYNDLKTVLEPLTGANRPFRHSARELLALSAWKAGDTAATRQWTDVILTDPQSPPGTRSRAEVLGAARRGCAARADRWQRPGHPKFVWIAAACALGIALGSCTAGWSIRSHRDCVQSDMFNTKKKISGRPRAVVSEWRPRRRNRRAAGSDERLPGARRAGRGNNPGRRAKARSRGGKAQTEAPAKARGRQGIATGLANASAGRFGLACAATTGRAAEQLAGARRGTVCAAGTTNWPAPPATAQTNWPPPAGQQQQGAQSGTNWPNPPGTGHTF